MKDDIWVVVICIIVGICLGAAAMNSASRYLEIKHHAAHYDQQTGNFTWNQ
jgi:hypothetical protein